MHFPHRRFCIRSQDGRDPLPPLRRRVLPYALYPLHPPGVGGYPEAIQHLLPRLDLQRACRHKKRSTEAPLNTDFGLLIR